MRSTKERHTAEVILQKKQVIEVGGVEYTVAPPSIATLILVSELVAEMPYVNADSDNVLSETLRVAKDCSLIGDILATLILGANKVMNEKLEATRKRRNTFKRRNRDCKGRKELAADLLQYKTPEEIADLTVTLLKGMQVASFFGSIAFLSGINLLKPTRESETTVSGQP